MIRGSDGHPIDDIDTDMLDASWTGAANPGEKVDLGVGLIARRYASGDVYDRKLSAAELRRRIDEFYCPYHRQLEASLDAVYRSEGAVWHVNCHSMPAVSTIVSPEGPGVARPEFCLGDREGSTCEKEFTEFVRDTLTAMGYQVTVNDPYKGVELVRRYSSPRDGRHSLQIEINRALYMDERTVTRAQGFDADKGITFGLAGETRDSSIVKG